MVKKIDKTQLSITSIEELIEQSNQDLCETIATIIGILHTGVANNQAWGALGADIAKELQGNQLSANNLNLGLELFKAGQAINYYLQFKQLTKRYGRLFWGVDVNQEHLLQCLRDLEQLEAVALLPSQCNATVDKLHQVAVSKDSQTTEHEALYTSVSALQKSSANLSDCLDNYTQLVADIKKRVLDSLQLVIANKASRAGLDFDQAFTETTFLEQLRSLAQIAPAVQVLCTTRENAASSLYSVLQLFKDWAAACRDIDSFHPAVRRTKYLIQALSSTTPLNAGYCAGGIRYWAGLDVTSDTASAFKHYFQLNEDESVEAMIALQKNASSKVPQRHFGSCFFYSLEQVRPALSTVQTDKTASLTHLQTIVDRLAGFAKMYHYQVTFQLNFMYAHGTGHAVGFKVIEHNKRIYYYFRDHNIGEYVTEEVDALKQWLVYLFDKLDYSNNLVAFDLIAIRSTHNLTQHPVASAFRDFGQRFNTAESSTSSLSKPMQKAFSIFQQSSDSVALNDDELRKKMLALFTQFKEEEVDKLLKLLMELYSQLINKNEGDCIMVFAMIMQSLKFLAFNSRAEITALLRKAESIIQTLITLAPNADSTYLYLWVNSAVTHLQFCEGSSIESQDEIIVCLNQFTQKCDALDLGELNEDEIGIALKAINVELKNNLQEKPLAKKAIETVVGKLDALLGEYYQLWMNESLVDLYDAFTNNIDDAARTNTI